MSYGLTETGFVAKIYDQIKADMIARAREYFGSTLDERSTNPLIKIIESTALELAYIWQVKSQYLNNMFVANATGAHLDKLGYEMGLDRRVGSKAIVTMKITGQVGAIVPTGTIFSTSQDQATALVEFQTTSQLQIGALQEIYDAAPQQTDTIEGDGGFTYTTTKTPYNESGIATCVVDGVSYTEVAWTGTQPGAGQFALNYGSASNNLMIGTSLSAGKYIVVTYTYKQTWCDTTSFVLNYLPVNPIQILYRDSTLLTEVASSPGANEYSCNYDNGTITVGQTIVYSNIFTISYLNIDATYGTVGAECTETGTVGNVGSNKIKIIPTPIPGVSSATNEAPASGGTEDENDYSYRSRLVDLPRVQWTPEKMESELESISGVRSASIVSAIFVDEFVDGDQITRDPPEPSLLAFEFTHKPEEAGVKRAEIQKPYSSVILTEVSGVPSSGEFQVDYPSEYPNGPWTIEIPADDFDAETDKLFVIYTLDEVNEGYFHCYIVGDSTPVPASVLNEVRGKLNEIKPLSIGFMIYEPDPAEVEFTLAITLSTGYASDNLPAIKDSMESALEEISVPLNTGDALLRNELIKKFMLIDGVSDITLMTFKLIKEDHIQVAGQDDYPFVWCSLVSDITEIKDEDETTYTEDTDFELVTSQTPNLVRWMTGGSATRPAAGKEWYVTFKSVSGNVTPRLREIIKIGTLTVNGV